MTSRPFKVWNHNRTLKKSVTASSLSDLVEKGRGKLDIDANENVRVVLEQDGTEVDEEDYFSFVPNNSTFMILRRNEEWNEVVLNKGSDETDYGTSGELNERTKCLIQGLQKDLSRIIAFSNEDLENIVSANLSDLCQLLQETESYGQALQNACQRHLDERQQTAEAIDLLRLYHQSHKNSPYVEDGTKKRKSTK